MANDLLVSFNAASIHYSHVVFNERTQQFERAGKLHALAAFFGNADAKAKNEATLRAIRQFMAIERAERYGAPDISDRKDYFAGVKTSNRIESRTISRIIAKMRDDMAVCPSAKNAAKEKVLQSFLDDELNWGFLRPCFGEDGYAMAETMARFLLDGASRRMPVADSAGLERFREEADVAMRQGMKRLSVFIGHNRSDMEALRALFETFRAHGAENGNDGECLERLMSVLFAVIGRGEGELCDEIAVSRFLSMMEHEKMLNAVKSGKYSTEDLIAAFNAVLDCPHNSMMDCSLAAFELKLNAGEMFDNFENANVLNGLAAAFADVSKEDAGDFLSVTADILKHNKELGRSLESVETCARTVNATLQFLRAQCDCHPDALKDGVRLMKDLHAPIGMDTMKFLLDMARKVSDGLLDSTKPFEESLDRRLSMICFAGNGIESAVDKESKNWMVAKFVMASTPKVRYPSAARMYGEEESPQRTCAANLLATVGSLRALYIRADRALCEKYMKALDFLVDRYWETTQFDRYVAPAPNVNRISKELLEKYDMQNLAMAMPDKYKTKVSDFREFDGLRAAQATKAADVVDIISKKARIFNGDKVRVRHLAMQEIAFLSRNGRFPDIEMVQRIAYRYCRMAQWGGGLMDRLAEISVEKRKAVVLAMEAYGYSCDAKLFDMLTKDAEVLDLVVRHVDECERRDGQMQILEGSSVTAWDIHVIITGKTGMQQELDPAQNPHLATIYSRQP